MLALNLLYFNPDLADIEVALKFGRVVALFDKNALSNDARGRFREAVSNSILLLEDPKSLQSILDNSDIRCSGVNRANEKLLAACMHRTGVPQSITVFAPGEVESLCFVLREYQRLPNYVNFSKITTFRRELLLSLGYKFARVTTGSSISPDGGFVSWALSVSSANACCVPLGDAPVDAGEIISVRR